MSEALRCGGTKRITQPITVPYCDPGDSPTVSETDCPGCSDCQPNRIQIGKYLWVELVFQHPGRKTKVWQVTSEDREDLGKVRWYGPWRQYTFWPQYSTLFHEGCLNDLAVFLKEKNKEHREERQRGNER